MEYPRISHSRRTESVLWAQNKPNWMMDDAEIL